MAVPVCFVWTCERWRWLGVGSLGGQGIVVAREMRAVERLAVERKTYFSFRVRFFRPPSLPGGGDLFCRVRVVFFAPKTYRLKAKQWGKIAMDHVRVDEGKTFQLRQVVKNLILGRVPHLFRDNSRRFFSIPTMGSHSAWMHLSNSRSSKPGSCSSPAMLRSSAHKRVHLGPTCQTFGFR